jgi:Predicted amidohydrolase
VVSSRTSGNRREAFHCHRVRRIGAGRHFNLQFPGSCWINTAKSRAKYRKTHLYAVAPVEEQKCFVSGDTFGSFALDGLRFGFSICYDLRFPEMYRKLVVEQNVGAIIVSSAWPFPRIEHFRTLALARAIENQSYVIASNRVGKDDDLWFCGSSAIIDPRGVAVASASADREELIQADVSQELVLSVRTRVESLAHRREDLYRK